MACSTERRAAARGLAALMAALLNQGCATGALFEAGRRTEQVVSYREAYTDGERLWLVYETATSDRGGETVGRASRTAVLALADLDPARGHPIDALPWQRTRRAPAPGLRSVTVRPAGWAAAPTESGPALLAEAADGRHTGLAPVGFADLPPDARLDSGALRERRTAPWIYPLLPLAAAYDAVTVPVTVVLALPFFVIGD